jgi:hypothetical protein
MDINLFTWEGYHARYIEHIKEGYVGRVAWEKTEDEYREKTGGVAKYSTHESFKVTMSKKNKQSVK